MTVDFNGIAQIVTALGALIAAVSSLLNRRKLKANAKEMTSQTEQLETVRKATNSLTDRLVETSKTEAHAAGLLQGRTERAQPTKNHPDM